MFSPRNSRWMSPSSETWTRPPHFVRSIRLPRTGAWGFSNPAPASVPPLADPPTTRLGSLSTPVVDGILQRRPSHEASDCTTRKSTVAVEQQSTGTEAPFGLVWAIKRSFVDYVRSAPDGH